MVAQSVSGPRRIAAAVLGAADRVITAQRVRAYAAILIVGYLLGWGVLAFTARHGLDAHGKPLGADFIIFYGVSRLTLAGRAALAYAPHALLLAERGVAPASRGLFLWTYPPTFQLVVAPLALAPYLVALAAWSAAGLAAYLAVIAALVRDRRSWWLALAFPGVFMCLAQGQTGLVVTALLGGVLLLVDRRPLLAGVLLGLLAIKPQFAVLAPLLFLVDRRWRALAAAAVTAVAFAAAATLVFGLDSWLRFLAAAGLSARALEVGALPIWKDPSLFAALIAWRAPPWLALALQGAAAIAAVILALRAWRGEGPRELKAGVAVLATLIVLPYLFDYDLALLAIPIGAAMISIARRPSAPLGVKTMLAVLAVTPILLAPIGQGLRLPLGPPALWGGLAALLALLRREARAPAP
jgi:hypothetical protein